MFLGWFIYVYISLVLFFLGILEGFGGFLDVFQTFFFLRDVSSFFFRCFYGLLGILNVFLMVSSFFSYFFLGAVDGTPGIYLSSRKII